MAKHRAAHATAIQRGERCAAGIVGKVPEIAQNALFKRIRVPTGFEHVYIVVGFDQDEAASRHCIQHALADVARICQDGKLASAAAEYEAHRFVCIVRGFERQHIHAAEIKIPFGFKHAHLRGRNLPDERQHAAPGSGVGVHRQAIAPRQYPYALNVVAVLMGNKKARKLLRRNARFRKRIRNNAPRQARIYQNRSAVHRDEQCIAG